MKRTLWIIFAALALLIGLYPLIYLFIDRQFGLLSTKSEALLAQLTWNVFFYIHIFSGALALLTGWVQFSSNIRQTRLTLHRRLGKVYISTALLSSVSGIYIGFFATAGPIAAMGFILLGLVWLITTVLAYRYILNKHVYKHQSMMIYSYAACFAAVTLRLWLPFLIIGFGDFNAGYRVVAWLCWVPNLVVAYFINQSNRRSEDL